MDISIGVFEVTQTSLQHIAATADTTSHDRMSASLAPPDATAGLQTLVSLQGVVIGPDLQHVVPSITLGKQYEVILRETAPLER